MTESTDRSSITPVTVAANCRRVEAKEGDDEIVEYVEDAEVIVDFHRGVPTVIESIVEF